MQGVAKELKRKIKKRKEKREHVEGKSVSKKREELRQGKSCAAAIRKEGGECKRLGEGGKRPLPFSGGKGYWGKRRR